MRFLVLLPACLATAAAAAVVEPELAAPTSGATYSPQTQATIEWIATMDAAAAAARAAEPPVVLQAPPTSQVPGTGIHRCAGADGNSIFTDKRCEDLGAVASAAPSAGNASTRLFVQRCARTREALVDGLRNALDAQDANRVASYYHWTGMGNRAAYALMERLHSFSQRPVMDVQLVTSGETKREGLDDELALGWYPMLPTDEPPAPPPQRKPDLVRVDQMRAYDDAASEVTYFRLQANAGCWWIHF
jgi:hypothetical protein